MSLNEVKCLILAGGRSSRFGSNKALVPWRGKPLIAHVIEALNTYPCAISGGSAYGAFGLPLLDDAAFAGEGPLAGICAGLAWAQDAAVLITVPCDTPILPPDLVPRLLPGPAFARAGGRDHHLVASWPVAHCLGLADYLRGGGSRAIRAFGAVIGAQPVEFEGDARWFANVNRPEDLASLDDTVVT